MLNATDGALTFGNAVVVYEAPNTEFFPDKDWIAVNSFARHPDRGARGGDIHVDLEYRKDSTRSFVGTGENVMIGGFIVGAGEGTNGAGSVRVWIRGIGPSLTSRGIANERHHWGSVSSRGTICRKQRSLFLRKSRKL